MWRFLLLLAAISAEAGRYAEEPPTPACSPEHCSDIYEPICALCANGQETTLPNECHLRVLNCDGVSRCSIVHEGECQSKCEGVCPEVYEPVCAFCENGEEIPFGNECELNKHNSCNPHNQCTKVSDGECQAKCDVACLAVYAPVCALCDDGHEATFGNDCELGKHNTCNPHNQCAKLRDGECTSVDPHPPHGSGPSGPKPYEHTSYPKHPGHGRPDPRPSSPGHLHSRPSWDPSISDPRPSDHNPSYSGSYVPEPFRPRAPGPRPTCPVACPYIYQPVCADCRKGGETTFGNICELEAANVCNPHDHCIKLHEGECASPTYGPSHGAKPGHLPNGPKPVDPSYSHGPKPTDHRSHGPQPIGPYGPQPVGPYGPQPIAPYGPHLVGPFGPQPIGPYGPQPIGPYGPHPVGPYGPHPGASCPVACPLIYQPVCARLVDGSEQTFGNPCRLGAHNTCNPLNQGTQIYEGECRGVVVLPGRPLCPEACTLDYKPLCAQCPRRRQTFGNACSLQQHNCLTGEDCIFLKDGACDNCIKPCPLDEDPVCAICKNSRYRNFANTCLMENFNCQNRDNCRNASQAAGNRCPPNLPGQGDTLPTLQCDRSDCSEIYQPVCARCNHRTVTFQNNCALESHNCKNNNECKKIRDSECPPCVPYRCSSEKIPICAQCGSEKRTFDNECLFNTYNCPTGFECTKLYNGTCEETTDVCTRPCTKQYAPVCAQCPNGPQTFSTLCVLEQHNCRTRPGCTYLREGECGSSCEKTCPLDDIRICARCANNVYRNFPNTCVMDNHNCLTNENCQYVSEGAGCPGNPHQQPKNPPGFPTDPAVCAATDCSNVPKPVCARCGPQKILRTFTNDCNLNVHNCFNNQECTKVRDGDCQERPEPVICPTQHDPVCTTCKNGLRTFPNHCFLSSYQILNPHDGCTTLYHGTCKTKCPLLNCLDVQKPICALCGFEQKTFANECVFNSYNCPAGYECVKVGDGPCSSAPPLPCTGQYEPVCATCSTGLETFANECFMKAHNLAYPDAKCLLRNAGSCSEIPECPLVKCSDRPAPVCAVCGHERRTFVNTCQYNSYNCRSGYACRIQNIGSCRQH